MKKDCNSSADKSKLCRRGEGENNLATGIKTFYSLCAKRSRLAIAFMNKNHSAKLNHCGTAQDSLPRKGTKKGLVVDILNEQYRNLHQPDRQVIKHGGYDFVRVKIDHVYIHNG